MENVRQVTKTISLKALGITSTSVYYQLSPAHLHEQTIALQQGVEASSGALAIIHSRQPPLTSSTPK